MNHATPEQLNDYLDGSMPVEERAALQEHLNSCRRCLDELHALRETVEAIAQLPRGGRTRRDLWPSVAARTVDRSPITAISEAGRRRSGPRLSLSLPQAAAAGVAVAMLAGGAVWLALGGASSSGEVETSGPGAVLVATAVGMEAYDRIVADLTRQLNQRAERLEPETVATIQANLEIIDSAILEINEALARDPDNDYLNAYLARAMRKKVDVLRQAAFGPARL